MNDYGKKAKEEAEFAKIFGEILEGHSRNIMTEAETHSVTRTIRELGRAYLQSNNADSEYAQSWQDPSHAITVCNPLGRAIKAIVGEEIADSFWNHGEVETMVSDYLSTFNS